MFWEEWEYTIGGRVKSALVLGAVAVLLAQQSTVTPPKEVQQIEGSAAFSGQELFSEKAQEGPMSTGFTAEEEKKAQLWLQQQEEAFHAAMAQLSADNPWNGEYIREAEACYLQFAESLSWAGQYLEPDNHKNVTVDRAYCKGWLLKHKTQEILEIVRKIP